MQNIFQRLRELFPKKQKPARNGVLTFSEEEKKFVSELVAAGRGSIGKEIQISASGDDQLNTALLVIQTYPDSAAYCWNKYDLRPGVKKKHSLKRLRPLILARLKHEAAQSGEAVAQLARVRAQDVDRNGLEGL